MAPRHQQPNAKKENEHTGDSDEELQSNWRAVSVPGPSTGEVSSTNEGSHGEFSGLSEYVLEPLNKNSEFILYRGRARTRPSSLLLLTPASAHPAPISLKRLEHEYSLRADLDPAWAVRPIAASYSKAGMILVLEDSGGEPLARLIQGPMEMMQFLRLAVELPSALSHMHRRGLVHKDFKPSNVLVDPATGQVRLMGFGIASRLPRERQAPEPPEVIAGTLAYMAPEQTGRMNRSIDSRSDLYAFGVSLYEMLTGELPFAASAPMEWVHCHIARHPIPPSQRSENIPGPVSSIIMKLLAKNAEERYQTAAGAENDLRRCLTEWDTARHIDEFHLGEHDNPDRLFIPEKLYGRSREIDTLLAAFDRVVATGTAELVLVSGYSGVGKSSVVNELHKVLVPPRGFFASGKFDQYKRDIPYATLSQAFQGLIRPLLGHSEADLSNWRRTFHEALGPNARLVLDLVPELKFIIGEQPPVSELSARDAKARFHALLLRFIGVFARPEHPLALFLDDMQWLDAATLDLLEYLLTRSEVRHLMVIGAYRDNEVSSTHPLMRTLEAIRQAKAPVQHIVLLPLASEDLEQLVNDSLRCEPGRATQLAQLVHNKTAGNPFFAVQFIRALVEESLLTFDHEAARWSWDLNRIYAKGYTDNVVDLIIEKLNRLPVDTQRALQELSCLGNVADNSTLSIIHGTSEEQVHLDLSEAVRQDLVVRLESSYEFAHDRIQQAAYSLIPEESCPEEHLRIGQLLIKHTPLEKGEENIFDILHQVNRGASLITSEEERIRLAELNLIAGKRAKVSTAYASGLKYLTTGAALLPDDSWERLHGLTFQIELHRAECEFLTGESTAADQRLTMLSSRDADTIELATVACLRADLYTTIDQRDRAVGVCLEYLKHAGIDWYPHPAGEEGRREYERILTQLGTREVEELIELPLMRDTATLATLDVLTKLVPSAMFTDAHLGSLAICRAVNLSLEHGNSDGSCFAFVYFGMISGPHFGDYKVGFRFSRLGYELVKKKGLNRFQARTYMLFGSHVMPWTKHVQACREVIEQTFEAANKTGDLSFAAYSRNNLITNLLATGAYLAEVQQEADNGLEFAQRARFGLVIDIILAQRGLVQSLRGLTPKFGYFDDGQFDELQFEAHLASDQTLALPECFYWIRKLQARFFANDYPSAIDASLRGQRLLWAIPSNFEIAVYHFYAALARSASCDSAASDQYRQNSEALAAHYRMLAVWAEYCPANFGNRAALVGAEIARIEGRELDAERLYEEAIRSARTNGFIHNEGLAFELAAGFYASRDFRKIADAYLSEARYCYLRWGATGKVRQLEESYEFLRNETPAADLTSTIGTPVESLDLATVIKVLQTVSGELVLEKLIDTVMRTAIEHAGAERGLLILLREPDQRIEAEAWTSGDSISVRLQHATVSPAVLPESVFQYVVRTQENVILGDAAVENPFSEDAYIRQQHARSILCLALMNRGKLMGVLYLENNLAARAFTPTRIAVLKILASQAAISLENTRLYSELEAQNAYLLDEIRSEQNFGDIIGASSGLRKVMRQIEMVAPTDATVLITGESGTGKELVARAVHERSGRSGRTLVKLNCSAVPEGLFESEFFGHVKGSFTGALKDKPGRFELADGGTLFLDEIGEVPLAMQAKLLRVLQEQELERIGDTRTRKVNVRIIAATNRDVKKEVDEGRFREDLFYRLSVFPLEVPPLRERRDDIPLLAAHFIRQSSRRMNRSEPQITKAALTQLTSYDWPGNVRQLQNVIERSVILWQGGPLTFDLPVPQFFKSDSASIEVPTAPALFTREELRRQEREAIVAALKETKGKVSGPGGAAELLGMKPTTLASRISTLGLKPKPLKP